MTEKIGLEAQFQDKDWKRGTKEYDATLTSIDKHTDKVADSITKNAARAGESWAKAGREVGIAASVIGGAMTAILTKSTLTAARTEELGVVVDNVGRNIGKTTEQMDAYVEGVKAMGITTQAARQSVIQMAQAQIGLEHSADLARLAQDAAVIAQLDSSQAMEQLITVIQRGSTVMARTLGLTVDFNGAYQAMAKELGIAATELTKQQKIQARTAEVMANSVQIAGTYEAAMGTAGKQLRSMRRHTEEAMNALGEGLLPVMGEGVDVTTDLLKAFNELPDPLQKTVAQMGAGTGALLTMAGAAAVAGPKLLEVGGAILSLGPAILGPAGLVAALAAVAIYLHNLEQAHIAESAAAADTAKTYRAYVEQMDDAGQSTYALTEGLYNLVKAQEAAQQAAFAENLLKSQVAIQGLTDRFGRFNGEADDFLRMLTAGRDGLSKFDLVVLQDADAVAVLGTQLGLTGGELLNFVADITAYAQGLANAREEAKNYAAFEQKRYKVLTQSKKATEDTTEANLDLLGAYERILDVATPYLDRAEAIAYALEVQAEATEDLTGYSEDLAEIIQTVKERYSGFYSTLADGLGKIRDLGTEAQESTRDYRDGLSDLNADASEKYAGIREKYENSLPDKTSISERHKMQADAWDEWALRFQDIIQNGVTEPWLEDLEEMGYAKPPDVGVREWAADMLAAFYEGNLPELINEDAAAWVQHAAEVEAAQQKETQAVANETAKRKALLEQQRQEQLEAQRRAREEYMLELSLSLLDEADLLDQWAQERFGPMADVIAPNAEAVLSLIQQGVVDIDGELLDMLTSVRAGVEETLGSTGEVAEENKAILDDFFATDWTAAITDKEDEVRDALDLKRMIPPEDIEGTFGVVTEKMDEIAELDPWEEVLANFEGMKESIETGTEEFVEEMQTGLDDIKDKSEDVTEAMAESWGTLADDILDAWITHSVVTDLVTGSEDVHDAWADAADLISRDYDDLQKHIEQVATKSAEKWEWWAAIAINAVHRILGKLKEIPTRIVTKVFIQYAGIIDPEGDEPPPDPDKPIGNAPLFGVTSTMMRQASAGGASIGQALAEAIIVAIQERLKQDDWLEGLILGAGSSLGGFGRFFSRLYEDQSIDPVIENLSGIDKQIKDLTKEKEAADKTRTEWAERELELEEEIWHLENQRAINLKERQAAMAILNSQSERQAEAQATLVELQERLQKATTSKEYAEIEAQIKQQATAVAAMTQAEKELVDEYNRAWDEARALDEDLLAVQQEHGEGSEEAAAAQAKFIESQAKIQRLEEERVRVQKEYQERQERLLEIEEARADLEFLEQQYKLLELIKDYGLDSDALLSGVTLGLGADVGQLMDVMTQALQGITANLNAGLGGSVPFDPGYGVLGAPGVSQQETNIRFGSTTINNGMDAVAFESMVQRAVQKAMRGY